MVTGATARSNIANLYLDTPWQSISERRDDTMLKMLYKVKNNLAPDYLRDLLPLQNQNIVWYNLRNNKNIPVPSCRLDSFKRLFFPFTIKLLNDLSLEIRESLEQYKFYLHEKKKKRKIHFITMANAGLKSIIAA